MAGPLPLRSAPGALGTLRWHYQIAAGVIDFVIIWEPTRRVWMLRGGLIAPNPYMLTQTPLDFVTPATKSGAAQRWRVVTITVVDNRLTATLTPGV